MMIGLGLTIVDAITRQSVRGALVPQLSMPTLPPAEAWNGIAGTGFTVVPTDPTRTTAKPMVQLVTTPLQRFTDTVLVGVQAFANNGGTLIGGIDRVRFHFEGNSVDVIAPSFRTIIDANGVNRTYWGYWIELKRGSVNGTARLYVEAIPADATMQRRVIGPFTYFPQASAYSMEIEVAPTPAEVPGSRYKTLSAALTYLRSNNISGARVTFTENTVTEPYTASVGYTGSASWTTITTAPGVTATFSKASFDPNTAAMRMRFDRLHFKGSGIVLDFKNMLYVNIESTGPYWLDGIRVTNSDPAGPLALWAKGPRSRSDLFSQSNYYTEVDADYGWCLFLAAQLIRGGVVREAVNDLTNNSRITTGLTVEDGDNTTFWNVAPGPAMSIRYDTGPGNGSAATVQRSSATNPVFTFRVDGATVGTFTMLDSPLSYLTNQYNVSDLVDYINGPLKAIDPGFSATLIDNTRKGSGLTLTTGSATSFAQQTLTDTTLELVCRFDLHTDFFVMGQTLPAGDPLAENIICSFNTVRNFAGQLIHMGGTSAAVSTGRDVAIVGNIFDGLDDGNNRFSQVRDRTVSHIVIAHNTWNEQPFSMGVSDSVWEGTYSLIANNCAPGLLGTAGTTTVKNNHVQAAGSQSGSGSTIADGVNDTLGGTTASIFVDAAAGDFRPAGQLLLNLKEPVLSLEVGAFSNTATTAGAVLVRRD